MEDQGDCRRDVDKLGAPDGARHHHDGERSAASSALEITSELAKLPLDQEKRDELIIYTKKFLLKMGERLLYFTVLASFLSTELGRPWPIPDWLLTIIATTLGTNTILDLLENANLLKSVFEFLSKLRRKK